MIDGTSLGLHALLLLSLSVPPPPSASGPDTRPRIYFGPGYYCAGGFVVRLEEGDRAGFAPPEIDVALLSLEIGRRRIRGGSGAGDGEGRIVARYPELVLRQNREDGRIIYSIDDGIFSLSLTSDAFRGYRRDRWFFDRVNFHPDAERQVTCLEEQSAQ